MWFVHAAHHRPCTLEEFRCPNEQCIKLEWKCDGDDDCGDMGDEPDNCSKCLQLCLLLMKPAGSSVKYYKIRYCR